VNIPKADCIVRVRHPGVPFEFNVSFIRDSLCGVVGVKGFRDCEKKPRRGRHMLLTDSVRNWIGELEEVSDSPLFAWGEKWAHVSPQFRGHSFVVPTFGLGPPGVGAVHFSPQ
jgi:hypothetical protein